MAFGLKMLLFTAEPLDLDKCNFDGSLNYVIDFGPFSFGPFDFVGPSFGCRLYWWFGRLDAESNFFKDQEFSVSRVFFSDNFHSSETSSGGSSGFR